MIAKIRLSALLLMVTVLLMNCSDDKEAYSCKSCVDTPEAAAANDASGKGIYKGVVVGSTGTIKLNIANTGNTISGVLVIDGKTINLTPYQNQGVFDEGYEGYLSGTMTVENDVLVWFTVNANGTEYSAGFEVLPGHPDAVIEIIKEYSTLLVQGFEGTFSGGQTGTFNLVVYMDDEDDGGWYAVSKDSEDDISFHGGDIADGELSSGSSDVIIEGEIDDDEVSGTWATSVTDGTWKGKRTL